MPVKRHYNSESDTAMASPTVILPVYKGFNRIAIWPGPNLVRINQGSYKFCKCLHLDQQPLWFGIKKGNC